MNWRNGLKFIVLKKETQQSAKYYTS